MTLKEEYNRLFERVASRMSDDKLFRAVLEITDRKGYNMNKKNKICGKRAVIIPLVCAGVVAATSIGAAAVYSRSVSSEYKNALEAHLTYYGNSYTDSEGNRIPGSMLGLDEEVYERLSVSIDQTFELDDLDLHFTDMITDGRRGIVMYTVTPKGDKWSNIDKELLEEDWGLCWLPEGERGIGNTFQNANYSDGVFTGYIDITGMDASNEPVRINIDNFMCTRSVNMVCNIEESEFISYEINKTFEIPVSEEYTKFNKTISVAGSPRVDLVDWLEWNLDSLTVSPLGFEAEFSGNTVNRNLIKLFDSNAPIIVCFKDGTTLTVKNGKRTNIPDSLDKLGTVYNFDYPVDVDNIESIQIADAVVNVSDGSVTRVEIEKAQKSDFELADDGMLTIYSPDGIRGIYAPDGKYRKLPGDPDRQK